MRGTRHNDQFAPRSGGSEYQPIAAWLKDGLAQRGSWREPMLFEKLIVLVLHVSATPSVKCLRSLPQGRRTSGVLKGCCVGFSRHGGLNWPTTVKLADDYVDNNAISEQFGMRSV